MITSAARIQCAKTGFYQNPDDCRTFVACVLDPYYRKPYMHLMRCPAGLVWDNEIQICMEYSSTCNVGGFYSQKHSKLAVPTGYEGECLLYLVGIFLKLVIRMKMTFSNYLVEISIEHAINMKMPDYFELVEISMEKFCSKYMEYAICTNYCII